MCLNTSRWFNRLDRILAGLWWWQLRRYLAERKINLAPENSEEIDLAYREWKRYEFACKSGRPVHDRLAGAVHDAIRSGMDSNLLSLLIANGDILECDGSLSYRSSPWIKAMGLVVRISFLLGAFIFSSLLALSSIPLLPKLGLFAIIFSVLIASAYTLDLYTNRPIAAVRYLQRQHQQRNDQAHCGNIVSLESHPDFPRPKKRLIE